jgi:hypothetical protein
MRLARTLFALAFLAVGSSAWGQGAILQGGATTPGHAPMYVGQGNSQPVVQDSGTAGGGGLGLGLSELLQVNRTATGTGPLGAHACLYDNPTTNSAGYHYFCLDANAQGGGLLAYGSGGAASALPLAFNVNGVAYPFPFSIGGIVGPGTSVVNDAACWNNTVGTLLKDCGAFVTVGGNNTWTGTNNFTGTFQIGSVAQTFPASGNIVGTSDAQTLTNKSIVASQVNSGTLPGTVMPAYTGDVASSAGATISTIQAGVVTNAKLAVAGSANTLKGAATSTAIADLAVPSCSGAGNALQWLTGTGLQCGTLTNQTAGWGLTGSSTFSISTSQPPYGFVAPVNLGLTSSAAASALTISVVGANGSAPSATNPISIPFRSTTLATGTPVWATVTSALSIVIPSAATLGTQSSNVPFRIWIFVEYNGGSPEIVVATCSISAQIYPCTSWETNRTTTTTISGFATAAGTPYSTTGVSNDSLRIIGYCDFASGLATAGSWASSCTTLQLMGPGVKKPGDIIQTVVNSTTTAGTTTSATFATLSNAQSQAITPTSTINLIKVTAQGTLGTTAQGSGFLQVLRTATLIGNPVQFSAASSSSILVVPSMIVIYDNPGSASSTTYTFQAKISAGTLSYPNASTGAVLELLEIMGALDKPANDNGSQEQRMTG